MNEEIARNIVSKLGDISAIAADRLRRGHQLPEGMSYQVTHILDRISKMPDFDKAIRVLVVKDLIQCLREDCKRLAENRSEISKNINETEEVIVGLCQKEADLAGPMISPGGDINLAG